MKLTKKQLAHIIECAIDEFEMDRTQNIKELAAETADLVEKALKDIELNIINGNIAMKGDK